MIRDGDPFFWKRRPEVENKCDKWNKNRNCSVRGIFPRDVRHGGSIGASAVPNS